MIDFYNIASHNKQLTPEEVQKEASKSRPAWAVCHTIDHTAPGCQQDDHRDKVRTVAIFADPFNAEDFIKNCLPAENRENFYIVRLNPELEKVKEEAAARLDALGYNGREFAESIQKITGYYNGKPARVEVKQPNGESIEIYL